MKKILFSMMALGLAMTSCMNEDLGEVGGQYGYIDLAVTNEPVVKARATTVSSFDDWTVKAGDYTITDKNTVVKAGTYTVTAQNYADIDAALAANENWGDAYYYGSQDNVEVKAGQTTTVAIDCGKAKNGRISTSFNLLASAFSDYTVTVGSTEEGGRNLVFNSDTTNDFAYFAAGEVPFTFSYKYNNGDSKSISGKVTVVAGTEHQINISSNDNGTINLTINYDETFEDGEDQTITIDAATGEQVTA